MARRAAGPRTGNRRSPAPVVASATGRAGGWAGVLAQVTSWHPYQVSYLATCPHRHSLARTAMACARRLQLPATRS